VYLTVTFVVVILLLQNVDVGLQLPWVDVVLHKVFPVAVVADYVLVPPERRFSMTDGLRWLIYPLLWLAYTLARGAVVGWYPYPFLDPANGGYGAVAVTSARSSRRAGAPVPRGTDRQRPCEQRPADPSRRSRDEHPDLVACWVFGVDAAGRPKSC
jgi:hypothetical protein